MWRYLFLAPVYLLTTALPLASPALANLEYEYALASGILALVLLPLAGLFIPRVYLPGEDATYKPSAPIEFFWTCLFGPLIALLPVLFMYLAKICLCSATGTGFWMLVQWYPAWILAHAFLHLVFRLRLKGLPRLRIALGLLLIAAVLTMTIAGTLWFNPQKRLVSLVIGFLHGPIYDDWIAFDAGLLLVRASHLLLAIGLLLLTWFSRPFQRQWLLALAATSCFIGFAVVGKLGTRFPSTTSGKPSLDRLLRGTLRGEGFTLHYRPKKAPPLHIEAVSPSQPEIASTAKESPSSAPNDTALNRNKDLLPSLSIQRLHRDAQFHVDELKQVLGENAVPHIHIYIYPNDTLKKLWFGGGATDVTDVVTPSVHISEGSWPHPTLRHELVHAMTSGFAYHGLGFHPNMAFTEGLAVALAPDARSLSLDDGAASLLSSKRLPPLNDLFSPFFWQVSGSRAYTVAGSLLRYLINTHGIGGVKALYAGKSWDEAFGKPEAQLLQAWRESIIASYDKDKNELFSEALYRYPGILQDLCPHSKADLARPRDDGVFTRMRQPIGWDPDNDYLPWLLTLDPNDQQTRLKLWRGEIRKLAADRFTSEGRLLTWLETLQRTRLSPPKTLEDAEMAILESDLARQLGQTEASFKILQELGDYAQTRYLGESLLRELLARLSIEKTLSSEEALEWRRYLAGWRRSLPDGPLSSGPWLLSYLRLRNDRTGKIHTGELVKMLEWEPDPELAHNFHLEWYKILGHRFMRLGSYQNAHIAYKQAAKVAGSGSRDLYEEHARRASYYARLGALSQRPQALQHSSLQ